MRKKILIILAILLAVVYATCPTEQRVKDYTYLAFKETVAEENPFAGFLVNSLSNNSLSLLGALAGREIVVKNYGLITLAWVCSDDTERLELPLSNVSSIGLLGHVYVITNTGVKRY